MTTSHPKTQAPVAYTEWQLLDMLSTLRHEQAQQTKPKKLSSEEAATVRALRRELSQGRREILTQLRAIDREGRALWKKGQALERELSMFERRLERRIDEITVPRTGAIKVDTQCNIVRPVRKAVK